MRVISTQVVIGRLEENVPIYGPAARHADEHFLEHVWLRALWPQGVVVVAVEEADVGGGGMGGQNAGGRCYIAARGPHG